VCWRGPTAIYPTYRLLMSRCLLLVSYSLDLFLNPEDGISTLLRSIGELYRIVRRQIQENCIFYSLHCKL
jgi:hypothetical protein